MLARRALLFSVPWKDPRLGWLLAEFRLLVNESVRIALREDIRSRAAIASNEAFARAVRFQPGALRHDVVSPLYDLLRREGGAREEPSGVESQT